MSSRRMSRRRFLRTAGVGAAALLAGRAGQALAQQDPNKDAVSYNEFYNYPPLLGRVHGAAWIRIFKQPDPKAGSVRTVYWGYVMPIYRSVRGQRYDNRAWSDVWFETNEGYVHSAYVVPCHEHFNEPREVTGLGFWSEVTVPLAVQHNRPALNSRVWDYDHYRCYWGQVHRVTERVDDEEGRVWYRLYDDIEPHRQAWVQARAMRYISPDEFAPISPEVEDKRMVIDLTGQTLTCYESDLVVFKTRIASGTSLSDPNGNEIDFRTPYGEYSVQRKRPSRRMRGGGEFDLPYDVNGVPWVTYFTDTGGAVHGAYWHNNFGLPRSHGCINVTPDAGKWVYRWSQPYLGYEDEYHWVQPGELATKVVVV
jgi:hypothetical protein